MEPVGVFSVKVWESEALVSLRSWELSSDICAASGPVLSVAVPSRGCRKADIAALRVRKARTSL